MIRFGILGCGRIGQVHGASIKDVAGADDVPARECVSAAEIDDGCIIVDEPDRLGRLYVYEPGRLAAQFRENEHEKADKQAEHQQPL